MKRALACLVVVACGGSTPPQRPSAVEMPAQPAAPPPPAPVEKDVAPPVAPPEEPKLVQVDATCVVKASSSRRS